MSTANAAVSTANGAASAATLIPYLAFVTAAVAVVTATVAALAYRRAGKVEIAKLLKQIFDDLYLSGKFDKTREALDFDYDQRVVPALAAALATGSTPVTKEHRALLLDLDKFLNLIEYVLYLEQDKGLLTKKDRLALLSYWICWIKKPEHGRLQEYIHEFDYERLDTCVTAKD